jgi:protein-S-isoprenylcysteine O-methyltransferase Ste14
MAWAKYADSNTRFVIANPGTAMAVILISAFLAGQRLTELAEDQHLHSTPVILTAVFAFLSIWSSYWVVQALRKSREGRSSPSAVNE